MHTFKKIFDTKQIKSLWQFLYHGYERRKYLLNNAKNQVH